MKAKELTQEAIQFVLNNNDLYNEIAKFINVQNASFAVILKRNGQQVNQYEIVVRIARAMNKKPREIRQEKIKEVLQAVG